MSKIILRFAVQCGIAKNIEEWLWEWYNLGIILLKKKSKENTKNEKKILKVK